MTSLVRVLSTTLDAYVVTPFSSLALRPSGSGRARRPTDPNLVIGLPTEILLNIASYLDKEIQVLLSLTCKRIYHALIQSGLDLSLRSSPLSTRVTFLHYLERDYPEYLTCRFCGWMFLWRRYRSVSYGCPNSPRHRPQRLQAVWICWEHWVLVRREVIDLISRGPTNGLPISWLNSNSITIDSCNAPEASEARWVDGQILLALQWTREFPSLLHILEPDIDHNKTWKTYICPHQLWNWKYDTWSALENIEPGIENLRVMQKCSYCDSDFEVLVQILANKRIKVRLRAWKNLGSRNQRTKGTEGHFCADILIEAKLDNASVLSRDLCSLFGTGKRSESHAMTCGSHCPKEEGSREKLQDFPTQSKQQHGIKKSKRKWIIDHYNSLNVAVQQALGLR